MKKFLIEILCWLILIVVATCFVGFADLLGILHF